MILHLKTFSHSGLSPCIPGRWTGRWWPPPPLCHQWRRLWSPDGRYVRIWAQEDKVRDRTTACEGSSESSEGNFMLKKIWKSFKDVFKNSVNWDLLVWRDQPHGGTQELRSSLCDQQVTLGLKPQPAEDRGAVQGRPALTGDNNSWHRQLDACLCLIWPVRQRRASRGQRFSFRRQTPSSSTCLNLWDALIRWDHPHPLVWKQEVQKPHVTDPTLFILHMTESC